MLTVDWLGPEARERAAALWRDLESRAEGLSLYARWRWTSTWLEHFGEVVPHRFAVVRDGDEVTGLALVTRDVWQRGPIRIRRLHIGTAGEPPVESIYVERNRLAALPDRLGAVAAALSHALEQDPGADATVLDGFVESDARVVVEAGGVWTVEPQACLVADLASAPDGDVGRLFSSRVRKELRRAVRLAGPFEVEWAETGQAATSILDQLVELHQDRWTERGEAGAFGSRRVREFHHSVAERLAPAGDAAFMRVTGAHGVMGCRYAFVDGDRILAYQHGWNPFDDPRLSAGIVLDVLCMQAAHDRGMRSWDHLAGETEHKVRLSTSTYELVWATRRQSRIRWAARDVVRGLRGATRVAGSARAAVS